MAYGGDCHPYLRTKTEVQRGLIVCPRSHLGNGAGTLNPGLLGFISTTFGIHLGLEIRAFGFVYAFKPCAGNLRLGWNESLSLKPVEQSRLSTL